jgi:hypothetical protein
MGMGERTFGGIEGAMMGMGTLRAHFYVEKTDYKDNRRQEKKL